MHDYWNYVPYCSTSYSRLTTNAVHPKTGSVRRQQVSSRVAMFFYCCLQLNTLVALQLAQDEMRLAIQVIHARVTGYPTVNRGQTPRHRRQSIKSIFGVSVSDISQLNKIYGAEKLAKFKPNWHSEFVQQCAASA